MKKILAIIAAGAVLAAAATAEVTIGTWLRVQNALVASDGDDTYAGSVNSWGGVRYTRVNIAGQSEDEKAGFKMDIYDENGSISRGDNAYFWVRPIEQIKVSLGKYDGSENGLRGDFCYGQWAWLRTFNYIADDEGLTFDGVNIGTGLAAQIWPVDGLYIYFGVPLDSGAISNENGENDSGYGWTDTAKSTWLSSQLAVSYKIAPINSTIKVQWCGNYQDYSGTYDDGMRYGDIGVAFDFGMVENLYVTAGFRYRIADGDYQAAKELDTMKVALGVSYGLGNLIGWDPGFTIYASGGVLLYNGWDYGDAEKDPRFSFGVGLGFGIIEGLKVEADVRYINSEVVTDSAGLEHDYENDSVSFLIGVVYSVGSNGDIGIGFQGATNGCGFLGSELQYEDKFAWAIPLRLGISL